MTVLSTLERENHEPIPAPTWSDVQSAIECIDPRQSGFVILARSDGGYVQCAGAPLRLTIEWRRITVSPSFKHFVVGRPNADTSAASINTSAGTIRLQRNEILSIKNAIEVFREYFDTGKIPDSYVLRDNTAMFVAGWHGPNQRLQLTGGAREVESVVVEGPPARAAGNWAFFVGRTSDAPHGRPRIPDPAAVIDDLGPLMDIVRECIRAMRSSGIDQWDEVYPDRNTVEGDIRSQHAWVAATEREIIGFVVLNEHQDPEYSDVAWAEPSPPAVVHRLMVAPPWEGRGVGRSLMRLVEQRATELGFGSIRLDAFCDNARALQFYERDGYRRVGQVRFRKGLFDCFEKRLQVAGQQADEADGLRPPLIS